MYWSVHGTHQRHDLAVDVCRAVERKQVDRLGAGLVAPQRRVVLQTVTRAVLRHVTHTQTVTRAVLRHVTHAGRYTSRPKTRHILLRLRIWTLVNGHLEILVTYSYFTK